jgi:hypothetical protein
MYEMRIFVLSSGLSRLEEVAYQQLQNNDSSYRGNCSKRPRALNAVLSVVPVRRHLRSYTRLYCTARIRAARPNVFPFRISSEDNYKARKPPYCKSLFLPAVRISNSNIEKGGGVATGLQHRMCYAPG